MFDPRAGHVLAKDHLDRRTQTVILSCRFERRGLAGWSLTPVRIGEDLAPAPAPGEEGAAILRKLEAISAPLSGDGLAKMDLDAHQGARLVGHETRVLWYRVRRLHVGVVLAKVKDLRMRHLRMLVTGLRQRLKRAAGT